MIEVGPLDSLPSGEGVVVTDDFGTEIAIFLVEGTPVAIQNECPHRGGPLAEGFRHGETELECPWHAWYYDLTTGDCLNNPCKAMTYDVEIVDGTVFVHP